MVFVYGVSESAVPPTSMDPVPLPEQATAITLEKKRAVIVEDEGMTQLQLRKILRNEGMDVVGVAGNGRDGVDIVLREKPDLVLMDIRMPIMDGLEAARRILETYSVCIVMLTAFSDSEYQKEARDIGTCGYVLKPITAALLVPQIKAALQTYTGR